MEHTATIVVMIMITIIIIAVIAYTIIKNYKEKMFIAPYIQANSNTNDTENKSVGVGAVSCDSSGSLPTADELLVSAGENTINRPDASLPSRPFDTNDNNDTDDIAPTIEVTIEMTNASYKHPLVRTFANAIDQFQSNQIQSSVAFRRKDIDRGMEDPNASYPRVFKKQDGKTAEYKGGNNIGEFSDWILNDKKF